MVVTEELSFLWIRKGVISLSGSDEKHFGNGASSVTIWQGISPNSSP